MSTLDEGRDRQASPDREAAQRSFLIVAALVIAGLLLPWPSNGEEPSFQLRLLAAPPPLEEASLPEPPAPPAEQRPVIDVPRPPLPEPVVRDPEPLPEELAEPAPERLGEPAAPPRLGPPRAPRAPHGVEVGAPVRLGLAGLEPPELLHAPVPEYPSAAERAGYGGDVVIEIVIGRDGRVLSARLLIGLGRFGLDEAALEAVRSRLYSPGRLEGRPVEVAATIRLRFEPR